MPSVIDSYSESNADSFTKLPADEIGIGQCFTANGFKIVDCRFYLKKVLNPSGGAITAKIWTMTGTFGVDGNVGTLLATSDDLHVADIPTAPALITFTFTGAQQYTTTAGTHYVVTVEFTGSGGGGDYIGVGYDGSSATHPGTWVYNSAGTWNALDLGFDFAFYVDGDPVIIPPTEVPGVYAGGSRPRFRKLQPYEKRYREELLKRFKVDEEPEELETIRIMAEFLGRL